MGTVRPPDDAARGNASVSQCFFGGLPAHFHCHRCAGRIRRAVEGTPVVCKSSRRAGVSQNTLRDKVECPLVSVWWSRASQTPAPKHAACSSRRGRLGSQASSGELEMLHEVGAEPVIVSRHQLRPAKFSSPDICTSHFQRDPLSGARPMRSPFLDRPSQRLVLA